jgi:DNA polymerase-3 subunit gamma/tau
VLSRMLLPGAGVDPQALQVRLERLERQLARGAVGAASEPPAPRPVQSPPRPEPAAAAAAPEPARPPAPKPAAKPDVKPETPSDPWPVLAAPGQPPVAESPATPLTAPAAPGAVTLDDVVPAWPDLLAAIAAGRAPGFRTAGALLVQGQPVAVRGTELVLAFTPGNATNFQKSGNADTLLREALADRFGGAWKVTVVLKSPSSGTVELPPDAPPRRAASAAAGEPDPDMDSDSEVDLVGDGERARAQDPVAVAMEALGAQIVDERETG